MRIPRVVIAGAASGVGKTSVACAVIAALRRRGHSVRPFKVGPDYIDPMYLAAASGREARNLDVHLMGRDHALAEFVRNSDADASVIEGVMGYYDGIAGGSNRASTHHVASITKSPVLLLVDASRASRSVAATVLGFRRFHRDSRIAGVILNRIGSGRHESMCRDALAGTGVPVVGAVPRDPAPPMESRHLGLVSTLGGAELGRRVRRASKAISEFLDVDAIERIMRVAPPLRRPRMPRARARAASIGVALDASFNFYYAANLEALRREGASLRFFSPAGDRAVPECDGFYIGGGFPEVLASRLSRNRRMRDGIRAAAEGGTPVYAECGGLMYLTRSIRSGGRRYPMAGLFDAETVMTGRMCLNYTRGRTSRSVISAAPRGLRGHEFHYSRLEGVPADSRLAHSLDAGEGIGDGRDGLVEYSTLASYGHLYLDAGGHAAAFVRSCAGHSRR